MKKKNKRKTDEELIAEFAHEAAMAVEAYLATLPRSEARERRRAFDEYMAEEQAREEFEWKHRC